MPVQNTEAMPLAHPETVMPSHLGMSRPLAHLVEAIVAKTYHNLTVLAEILSSKDDMHRKLQIVKYVQQTRKGFIRLIALVKWANGVNKINKCSEILEFLDQESWYFTDTADRLYHIAHAYLPQARLPAFSVPTAIDVLTTGSYPDLPRSIKDRYVPPEPISNTEKNDTLKRLNQVIKCRLVSAMLPPRINDFDIDKGILSFTVSNEFSVDLTLCGEGNDIPWSLLRLKFLVKDITSHDSRNLVHHEHLQFLHTLCQSRLYKSEKPLCDLYSCLHSFCISLQLEVLHTQTNNLRNERWRDYLNVTKYEEGVRLVLSYWRDDVGSYTNKLIIEIDEDNEWKELVVYHDPKLPSCSIQEVMTASKINHLNIENLLMDTIKCRTRAKLEKLNFEIRRQLSVPISPTVTNDGNRLIVPLLVPGDKSEILDISVDPQTGDILPLLPGANEDDLDSLQKAFQDIHSGQIGQTISNLRFSLAKERCRRAASSHLACRVKKLNLSDECQSSLNELGHYVIFKLSRYISYYLVVELYDDIEYIGKIKRRYHLLTVERTEDLSKQIITTSVILNANPLDQFSEFQIGLKRTVDLNEEGWLDQDAELCHVISMCDSRIPFISLEEALKKEEIPHSGLLLESDGAATAIKLLKFPEITDAPSRAMAKLDQQFLSLTFRLSTVKDNRNEKIGLRPNHMYWMVEVVICPNELIGKDVDNVSSKIERITFAYEAEPNESFEKINVLTEFEKDWACVLRLYQLLLELLDDNRPELQGNWRLVSFNYQRAVIAYGDLTRSNNNTSFSSIVVVTWNYTEGAQLKFGEISGNSASNPHSMALLQFQNYLNESKSLTNTLIQIIRSLQLCRALARLPIHCSVGTVDEPKVGLNSKFIARQNFSVICESPSHYRLLFRGYYCIEFIVHSDRTVFIRDGAHSKFSNTKILEGLAPISGLIAFLRQGQPRSEDAIGELYLRHDDPMQNDLPQGYVWLGAEGASFNIDVIAQLLEPNKFNMGTDGYQSNSSMCRISITPLEQFLSSSYILEFIKNYIRNDMQQGQQNQIQLLMNNGQNSPITPLRFATQYVTYEVQLNPNNMKSLQLNCQTNGDLYMMSQNDISCLSHYFERKISAPPYRPNAAKAFINLITLPPQVLHDCIKMMSQEFQPNVDLPHRWTAQLCLTLPPSYVNFLPVGSHAVITINRPAQINQPNQYFTIFLVQLKSLGSRNQEITIPLKYHHNSSFTEIYMAPQRQHRPQTQNMQQNQAQLQQIDTILQRFHQMAQSQNQGQCSLYMAVQEIMNQFNGG